jgi:hypothetical protein
MCFVPLDMKDAAASPCHVRLPPNACQAQATSPTPSLPPKKKTALFMCTVRLTRGVAIFSIILQGSDQAQQLPGAKIPVLGTSSARNYCTTWYYYQIPLSQSVELLMYGS